MAKQMNPPLTEPDQKDKKYYSALNSQGVSATALLFIISDFKIPTKDGDSCIL